MVELQTVFVDYNKELQKKQGELTAPIVKKMIVDHRARREEERLRSDRRQAGRALRAPGSRSDRAGRPDVQLRRRGGDSGGDESDKNEEVVRLPAPRTLARSPRDLGGEVDDGGAATSWSRSVAPVDDGAALGARAAALARRYLDGGTRPRRGAPRRRGARRARPRRAALGARARGVRARAAPRDGRAARAVARRAARALIDPGRGRSHRARRARRRHPRGRERSAPGARDRAERGRLRRTSRSARARSSARRGHRSARLRLGRVAGRRARPRARSSAASSSRTTSSVGPLAPSTPARSRRRSSAAAPSSTRTSTSATTRASAAATIVAAQAGFAGSVEIGAGVARRRPGRRRRSRRVGDGARLAAKAGVIGDVAAGRRRGRISCRRTARWLRGMARALRDERGPRRRR